MKKLLLFLLMPWIASAQTPVAGTQTLEIIPPSPEAAKISQYGSIPVNEYNGSVSYSIPFKVVSAGRISLPVSLDYSTGGGIKVGDVASNAGLGWNLSGPSVVSRTILGAPDDQPTRGFLYVRDDLGHTQGDLEQITTDFTDDNSHVLADMIASSALDFQPDIFSYSFNGITGRFVFGWGANEIVNISSSNVKIEIVHASPTDIRIEQILFTTDQGIKYTFSVKETVQTYNTPHNINMPSSWYLEKIEDGDGNVVKLYYDNYSYRSYTTDMEIKSVYGPYRYCSYDPTNHGVYDEPTVHSDKSYTIKRLQSIASSGGDSIKFFYQNDRLDIEGLSSVNSFKSLDEVKLYKNASLINQWALTHDTSTQRLTLRKVEELGSAANPANPVTYQFDYYHPIPPSIQSKRIDHWGYHNLNAEDGSEPETLIPAFVAHTIYTGSNGEDQVVDDVPGADREPGMESANGLLKKITYPTGGTTTFEYELNDCGMVDDSTVLAMNIRPVEVVNVTATAIAGTSMSDTSFVFTIEGDTAVFAVIQCMLAFQSNNSGSGIPMPGNDWDDDGAVDPDPQAPVFDDPGSRPWAKCEKLMPGGGWQQVKFCQANFTLPNDPNGQQNLEPLETYLEPGSYRLSAKAYNINDFNNDEDNDIGSITVRYEKLLPRLGELKVGGARIKKIINYDAYSGVSSTLNYSYVLPGNDTQSSGVIYAVPNYHHARVDWELNYYSADGEGGWSGVPGSGGMGGVVTTGGYRCLIPRLKHLYLSVNPRQIPSMSGSHIGYEYVTVTESGNGKRVLHFSTPGDYTDEVIDTRYPFMPPSDYSYKTGLLMDEQVYNNNNQLVSKTENIYDFVDTSITTPILFRRSTNFSYNDVQFGIVLTQNGLNSPAAKNEYYVSNFFMVDHYNKNMGYPRLKKKTETSYSGTQTVSQASDYYYDATYKQYISKTSVNNSVGKWETAVTTYPFHYSGGVYTQMQSRHMLSLPVEQKQYLGLASGNTATNVTLLSSSKNTYAAYGTGIRLQQQESSVLGNALQTDLVISRYDAKGNILCYTAKDNKSVIFLWGYNGGYPVAKMEHIDTAGFYTWWNGQSALQSTLNSPASDAALMTAIQSVRSQFPNAMVTGFAYKPGVGTTCISDVNNTQQFYSYDAFNRLMYIKDANGKILKSYTYKFQGPQ